jgi:hypothetical protein
MSNLWSAQFKTSPLPILLSCGNKAIEYFAQRDLLTETVEPIEAVWRSPEVQKIVRKQQPNGSWRPKGQQTQTYPPYHDALVETWKNIRILVEQYQATRQLEAVQKASEFLFSCQTSQGDIRGMLANQYATYYTGAMLSVLIKAGYTNDPRVQKGLDWLLSMRQNDGGWTIPLLTRNLPMQTINQLTSHYAEPIEPNRTKPFSHNWTDMALRAFAAHPTRRHSQEAQKAADLLKSTFFQPDVYTSYQDERYWVRFMFWWPNLLTALDSLSLMGYSKEDVDIKRGLDWFIENQLPNGLWKLDYSPGARQKSGVKDGQYWLALKVAMIFRRFYEK